MILIFSPPFTKKIVFSFLLVCFGSVYCKQYGPRSDCSHRSSLIRVHDVCFDDKISYGIKLWHEGFIMDDFNLFPSIYKKIVSIPARSHTFVEIDQG